MSDKKIIRRHWKRPHLPFRHQGGGIVGGVFLIGIGFLFGVAGTGMGLYDIWLILAASAFVSLGLTAMVVSFILREIRRIAFEAALRAGEVEIEERSRGKFF